ncbi:MAG: 50S ribosomal protein L24 [Waddliaceae bacterium]
MGKTKRQNKHIRKDDQVMVISGNDKGLVGKVLSRTHDKVVVNGVNMRKKHVKRTEQNPSGGILELEKPIHISNVALCVDEEKPRKLRVGFDDVPFRAEKKH